MSVLRNISFPSKVLHDPAISRGDDGRYAVCSSGGIVIMHPILKFDDKVQGEIEFLITKVATPSEVLNHDVGNYEDFFKDLKSDASGIHKNYWDFFDKTISPCIATKQALSGFKSAKWSPHGVNIDRRCVLAGLTLDHRLCIYNLQKGQKWWSKILDLSELYYEKLKKENFSSIVSRAQKEGILSSVDLYKVKRIGLAAVDMVWTSEFHTELFAIPGRNVYFTANQEEDCKKFRFVLFGVALRNGQIAIWKLLLPLQFKSDCKLLTVKSVAHEQPTNIYWCHAHDGLDEKIDGFFTVGFLNGTVKAFVVKHSIDENFFSFGSIVDIWKDKDNIPIGPISWDRKMKILAVAKGPFILAFEIQMKSRSMEVAVVRSNHTTICSQYPINGLWKTDDEIYVTSSDRKAFNVKISKSQGMKIEYSEFPIPGRNDSAVKCHGIATSMNNVFATVVDSPGSHYCHLTLTNPLSVTCFNARIHKDVLDLIMTRSDETLTDLADAFLFLKYHYVQIGGLSNEVSSFIETKKESNDCNLYTLKLLRMFLLIHHQLKIITKCPKIDDLTRIKDEIKDTEVKILRLHVEKSLESFKLELDSENIVTDTEKYSAVMMCDWLSEMDYFENTKISQLVKVIKKKSNIKITPEVCSICSAELKHTLFAAVCPNNHTFYRCSASMIVCSYDIDLWECETCGFVYNELAQRDWYWIAGDLTRCTFCDSFVY